MRDTFKDPVLLAKGRRLQKLRKENGDLSQTELGKKIGATRSLVNMWESGERPVKLQYLEKIADLFGCTVDYLLCRSDNPSTDPDMQKAIAASGLSQTALENVKRYSKGYFEDLQIPYSSSSMSINNLLESDEFDSFFNAYQNVIQSALQLSERMSKLDDISSKEFLTAEEAFTAISVTGLRDHLRLAVFEFSEKAVSTVKKACDVDNLLDAAKSGTYSYVSPFPPKMYGYGYDEYERKWQERLHAPDVEEKASDGEHQES